MSKHGHDHSHDHEKQGKRHETRGLGAVLDKAGTALRDGGAPQVQEIVAGGEVIFFPEDVDHVIARLGTLGPNAELRAIAAVRAYARESVTLGDAHWRSIRCAATAADDGKRVLVRIALDGVSTRSLCGDALAGAAAALASIAAASPGATISDLRVYATDVEGRGRRQHPCALPADVATRLPPLRPALAAARCAVITLSDRASKGVYEDKSGARLVELLAANGGTIAHKAVLPDDGERLATEIEILSRRGDIELVICTGGTGIGPRDITPETLVALGIKPVPGIGELLRASSAPIVRSAWLSRAVAGTLGPMLVIALPGSHKAVEECMEVLLPLLPHTLSMLHGGSHG